MARVGKEHVALILVERVVILREVGQEQVEITVAVIIRGIEPHAGLLPGVLAQCDTGEQADFLERPVALVMKQQVWRGVVGHEDVGPAVVVEVAEDNAEAVVARVADPGRLGNVGKRAVAIVAVQHIGLAGQAARAADYVHAHELALAVGPTAPRHRFFVETQEIGDVKVDVSISVVVAECAVGAPARVADTRVRRDVRESSVAVVTVQYVGAEGRDVDIVVSIVVDVGYAYAHAPAARPHTAVCGHVGEPASAVVAIQRE